MSVFDLPAVRALIETALTEDLGRGDITSDLTVPEDATARAEVLAKQDGVIAGLPLAEMIFAALGAAVAVEEQFDDGDAFAVGARLLSLSGPARDLLAGERTVLNFLQQLSGVATLTRQYVDAVAGTKARIVDTRKTTPGLRILEKYAVRMGGGHNHRLGLDDGILIKDNHIVAAGGVTAAVTAARAGAPHTLAIECECTTIAEVEEALAAGAAAILLDNMTPAAMAEAVGCIGGRAIVEASGGVTLATFRAIADAGVDLISVGALTHSAPAIDLSMRIVLA
jgi:nicotinate-nucleotide pyrophosphorylase (carboxylating)